MKLHDLKLLFWYNKGREKIYLRITLNEVRSELSTGCTLINPGGQNLKWGGNNLWVKGGSPEARKINTRLKAIKEEIEEITEERIKADLPISSDIVKRIYLGEALDTKKELNVLEALKMALQIKKDTDHPEEATTRTYDTAINKFSDFIDKSIYKGIRYHQLTRDIASLYIEHLEKEGFKFNTRKFYFTRIQTLIDILMNEDKFLHPTENLFGARKIKRKKDETVVYQAKYLELPEFNKLKNTKLSPKLDKVRNYFLLQCYTGMGFAELVTFDPSVHIIKDIEGVNKIRISRQKTKRSSPKICEIPIFDETSEIIAKIDNFPIRYDHGWVYNRELKDLEEALEISHLHSHRGRHTFGTLMLFKGFSIESVSSMMGHAEPTITARIYAKISASKINLEYKRIQSNQ